MLDQLIAKERGINQEVVSQPQTAEKEVATNPENPTVPIQEQNTEAKTNTENDNTDLEQADKKQLLDQAVKKAVPIKVKTENKKETTDQQINTKKGVEKEKKQTESENKATPTSEQDTNVRRMALADINTDESRFQGRKKLNESVIKNIAENFSDKDQDPIHIWQDPKDGKTYVLSGHHRYYGAKMAGRNDVKVIDRSADFTEEQAIKFAKEEANANRSMETPLERANTLRDKRNRGDADIKEFLAKEGKNGRYVENLSYLNPKGKVMNMLNQLSETDDRATIKEMERIADWVGEVMKRFDGVLTKAHEDELYDFLMGEKSKRFTNKADFAENVRAIIDKLFFDNNQPLNLNRISNKGDGMRMWEEKRDKLKGELKAVTEKIDNLKARFTDPNHADYVSPDLENYANVVKRKDELLKNLEAERKAIEQKIIEHGRNRKKYLKGDVNTLSLFDVNAMYQKGNTPQRQRISDNTFWKFINKAKRFARGYFGDVKIFTDWNEFKTHANKLNGKDKVKQQKAQDTESLRLEKERIVSEAKANGTYMKAPNGQSTNLNEEQWVAVRTKAFKDWFGDWELGAKEVQIAEGKPHDFKNFAEAKAWAKENIARTYTNEETGGKGEINISNNSIAKYLSESSVERSDNKDVHLSVLKVLPQIIKNGIVAEQHADYNKNKQGARNIDSGINENVNIQRVFGAVNLEGRIYRVKVTLKEYKDKNTSKKPHSYEATKIELLAGTLVDTNSTNPNTNNSITGTNLLKGVEKSYEKGKFLLDHSKVVDQNGEPLVVYHGTNNYETTKKWNDKTKSYDNTHKEITVFKRDIDGLKNNGIFFNSDADNAYGYGSVGYEVFLNLTNPLIIEANGDHFSEVRHKGEEKDTYEWAEYAEKNKYDGVIFNNIRDGVDFQDLETPTDDYVAFHPNQIKSATDNVGTYSEDSDDIRYHIGDKVRQTYEQQIRKKNPNISEEHLQEALDFLHSLEDNKQNTKAIKVAVKWLETDAIRLPFAMDNVRKAIALAEKHKIDPMQFKSPMDIINKYYVDVEYGKEINPDKIPQFTNKRIIGEGENEVVVYDVEDSEAGQRAVTKICHQHFGYSNSQKGSKQPWCLASFTRKGEPTESAERYWFNTYNSVGKKIAFKYNDNRNVVDKTKKEISVSEFNRTLMQSFGDPVKVRRFFRKLEDNKVFYFTEIRNGEDYLTASDNFDEAINELGLGNYEKEIVSNLLFVKKDTKKESGLVPIAFMAHDKHYEGDLWWDLRDQASNNMPLPNGNYIDPDGTISDKKGGNEDDDLDQYYEDAVENVIDNMGNFSWREILQWNYGKVVYEGSRKMQTSGMFEDTESDIYERTNDLLKEEIERKINNGDFYSELEDKIEEYREYHEYAEDEELYESELDDIKQELGDEIFDNYHNYDGLEDLWYELEETAFEELLYDYDYSDYQKRMILEDYMAYSDNGYEYQEEVREEQERLWQEDGGGYTDLKFQIENDKTNAQFNNELRQMINGSLPSGHIFQLGRPNAILQSAGIPDLPIEMSSARLKTKAMQENHLFDLSEVENLPQAIQNPIGIFAYGDKSKSVNIITELQDKNGKKYLVGIHFNQIRDGLEVNSIRGIFPKDNAEWLNWINKGKSLYLDKKKVQDLITQQQTNLADVSYLDLNSVTKVLKNFQNPKQNNNLQELRTPSGVVYGAKLSDGSLYFNPDKLNYDTAIHELLYKV